MYGTVKSLYNLVKSPSENVTKVFMNTFIRIKHSKNITHFSLHNQQTTGTLIQQLNTTDVS